MNRIATFRILLAGVLAAIATIAVAQSSANFKSPAFSVNAGVGDMGSASFNARASVGQPFDATGVGSAGFAMRPGLFGIPVAAGAPGISVQPLSLTFPATSAGTGSVKQTVTISNTTAAPVTIGATMNSPAEFGHFAPSCGSTIAAMGTCTIEVELAPAAAAAIGPVSGSLSLPTSGGNLSVALSGSVTAFNTSAAPATIGFPITFVSQTSASQVVTITNNGSGTANVGLINFSGTDAGQFAVLSNTCTPPLASLGTCTATIRFAPTTDGAKTANLQFSYRGASLAVPVSGTAVAAGAPVFSPSATTLTFAPQTVATTSAAQTLSITNTGNAPLTISSSIVAGPFVLSSNNCATISPTASCAMSVTFAPLAPGAAAGALTITSNATGSPHSITLAGTGNVAPGTYAYIANAGRANVLVVDTTSNSVVTTIDVGTGPYGVAVNAAGTRAYVSSNVTGTLAVIDTATNTVLTTILVGSGPFGVAVNSVGTRVYVANSNDNNVSVIDTASNMVVATVGVGSGPYGVSLNPAGTRVYVANRAGNSVSVIDAGSNSVVATIATGAEPYTIAINAAGTRAYVTNSNSDSVSVIDTTANSVTATIAVNKYPRSIALNLTGTRAYVGNTFFGNVSVIDTATNAVVQTLTTGYGPGGMALNASGSRVYVVNSGSVTLSGIDTASNTIVSSVLLADVPSAFGQFIMPPPVSLTAPAITSAAPAAGTAGVAYSHTFTASGSAPFDWTVATGTLPPGLLLNRLTGVLSGTPTSGGTYSFAVQAASGVAPNDMQSVSMLVGSASAPVFSPSPASLTFPAQAVGVSSAAQTVTITNTGNAPLTISSPTITGPFVITANNCATIAAGSTCAMAITFTPVAEGAASGVLTMSSNAAGSPHQIAVNGNGTVVVASAVFAYISNQGSNNVSVIDTATNTVVATVPVGTQPYGVAVNPAGTRVYVTSSGSSNVRVIDTATNTVIATVTVGSFPYGVAVSADGTRAYVANSSNSVSVINTATNTVVATVTAGTTPVGIAVHPAGTRVYAANNNSNNVSVINTANNTVVATIPVGFGPYGVAINPAGTRVFVANSSGGISVINTTTNSVVANVSAGTSSPVGIAVNPAGTRVYVADAGGTNGSVKVIDAATNTLLSSIAVGRLPIGLAVHPDGTRVYVANRNDNNVSVIDTATNTVTGSIIVGTQPNAFGLFIGTPPPAPTVPGAPTIGPATIGNAQATISFTAPVNNGGSTITSYTATCSSVAAITRTASAAASPITVTGLTNFVGYNCAVTATNTTGTSPASANVTVLPIDAPGITSGAMAAGTVNATFSYQILTNAVADSYGVSGTLPNGVTFNATSGLISGTPTQAGTFSVTLSATNAGGTGSQALLITIGNPVTQYIVTPSAGANGSISPIAPQSVVAGATTTFTISPDPGYFASVGGSCGGTLAGNAYTTNAVVADCGVDASFILAPFVLNRIVSRKTHGGAGAFDLLLDGTKPISGNITVEPRIVGSGHKIVFVFDGPISNTGILAVVDSLGATVTGASAAFLGNDVIVSFSGGLNTRRVAITLTGVNGNVNASVALGFLVGDVDGSRVVDARDISRVKSRAGQTTNQSNFTSDITASGRITAVDVIVTKVLSGTALQ